jgi:hypothetical protein
MSKSLATLETEMLRLGVLQTLQRTIGYSASLDLLCEHHNVGMLAMFETVKWLEVQGLVEFDRIDGTDTVKITRLGQDVALGRTLINGVRRPSP